MGSPRRFASSILLAAAFTVSGLPVSPVALATPPVCQVWVTSRTTNYPTLIDGVTSDVSTLDIGDESWNVAMTPDGSKVYITTDTGTEIKVIDVARGYSLSSISTTNFVVETSPDGSKMYTTEWTSGSVKEFNTATDVATGRSRATGLNPIDMAVSPDGAYIYVANYNSSPATVTKIATSDFTATDARIDPRGDQPAGVLVSPDGSKLYVVSYVGGKVLEVDTSTMTITRDVTVDLYTRDVVSNSTGSKLYVTSTAQNTVVEINATTFAVTATISVGNSPQNLAISPDDQYLFVTNETSNTVSKIDLSTNTVVETIAVNNGPYDIAIGPSSCTTTASAPAPAPAPVVAPETTVETTTTVAPTTTIVPIATVSQPLATLPETGSEIGRWLWVAMVAVLSGLMVMSRRRRPT